MREGGSGHQTEPFLMFGFLAREGCLASGIFCFWWGVQHSPAPPPLYFGFSVYHGRIDTNILQHKITPEPISACGVFVALSHYRVPENQFSWRKQEMPSLFICTQKIIGRWIINNVKRPFGTKILHLFHCSWAVYFGVFPRSGIDEV